MASVAGKLKRVPRPWAAVLHLLLLLLVLLLFLGRKLDMVRPGWLLAWLPDFYSHVSNFSISYLLYAGIGYGWLLLGLGMRHLLSMGAVVALCNIAYEGFIPILNTRDWIDAGYGLAGTALALLVLVAIHRHGLLPVPTEGAGTQ